MDITTLRSFDNSNVNWTRRPAYCELFIKGTTQHALHMIEVKGYLFLNDVYDWLGLSKTSYGQIAGWWRGLSPLTPIASWTLDSEEECRYMIQFHNHEVIFQKLP